MTEDAPNGTDQVEKIHTRINQALKEIDQIRNTQSAMTSPTDLENAEQAIIKATDKLAALITALKIQQAVDSDELDQKAEELVQAIPEKLKNQGRRLVSVQTSRGEPVQVAAPYYSRKKKNKKRKKKKKS